MRWSIRLAGACCLLFIAPPVSRADFLVGGGPRRDALSLHVMQAGCELEFAGVDFPTLAWSDRAPLAIRVMIATLGPVSTLDLGQGALSAGGGAKETSRLAHPQAPVAWDAEPVTFGLTK
jgi:hypothetical protein